VSRALRFARILHIAARVFVVILASAIAGSATDWSAPEQQLARKIVALAGSGSMSLTVENRSSLGRRDSEIVQNGLRTALESMGARFVANDPAATVVTISLSENLTAYVWVAQVRSGTDEPAVAIVSTPRPASGAAGRESVPLSLRKISLWSQADPILDVGVLEEGAAPTRIAVLDPRRVSIYRSQAGSWQREQALEIVHDKPWPRDVRGRMLLGRDGLAIYLPGVVCHGAMSGVMTLSCHAGDDPWPLAPVTGNTALASAGSTINSAAILRLQAFSAPDRNFFTGALTSAGGKLTTVSKFYSAALVPRDGNFSLLFAGVDGQVHISDGNADRTVKLNWGSDLTGVKTGCGAGWQVLATSPSEGSDSVRVYEVPDRDPVAVSAVVDFSGAISALWTEGRGDTAVVVTRNSETDNYEAFRLAVACSQ
jgi:hypothetical protein